MTDDILNKITVLKDTLPKKQQKLCTFLLINAEQVGVMTVAELAKQAEVGTTTVMRLVQILDFPSFSAFKREILNATLMNNTTSYRGLKQGFTSHVETESGDIFRQTVADGLTSLNNLCTPANIEAFESAIVQILEANQIFALGMRSSKSMALFFESAVNCFYPKVQQLSFDTDYIYDHIALRMTPEDVLVVISVWPCTRTTIDVAEVCHTQGIPIVLITNTRLNPIGKMADVIIDTNSVKHSNGGVPIMAVLEAMISELGRRTDPISTQNIEKIETVLGNNNIVLSEY